MDETLLRPHLIRIGSSFQFNNFCRANGPIPKKEIGPCARYRYLSQSSQLNPDADRLCTHFSPPVRLKNLFSMVSLIDRQYVHAGVS